MKTYLFLAIGLLLLGSSLNLQAQSSEEIQEDYMAFLKEKEIDSKIDKDGDVQFRYENKTYFLDVDEKDPTFFRLVLANIWPIQTKQERMRVLQAMDYANSKIKVGKMYIVKDNIWVGIEIFQKDTGDYKAYFDRSLKVILQSIEYFKEGMAKGNGSS